ncbi:MAG: glycosyltransferase family 39 protein [Thermoguttaceae bacterium]
MKTRHSPLISLLLFLVAIYVVAFFAVPFTPYAHKGTVPPRGFFFLSLLVPENFVTVWTGENGTLAIVDRVPILAITILGLAMMRGYGRIVLALLRVKLARLESELFAIVLGMNVVSTLVLLAGMAGVANNRILIFVMTLIGVFASCIPQFTSLRAFVPSCEKTTPRLRCVAFSCLAVFATLVVLAGAVPSTEYDVVSYHLAAARDFAETGRIGFVAHTPYANMPFGAEMWGVWAITLYGKTLCGDAFIGGLVFKTLVAATTVVTGLGLYAFGVRLGSERIGLVAMLLYVSTPWILYTSTVGLVDSVVGMNAWFAFYAVWLARRESAARFVVVAGLCAGGAAACKYTAIPMVVVPLAVAVFWPVTVHEFLSKSLTRRHEGTKKNLNAEHAEGRKDAEVQHSASSVFQRVSRSLIFLLAVFVACGAWYVKNWWWTGNPFYPLAWSIFGDSSGTWDAAVNARWSRVHSPPLDGFTFAAAARDFVTVTMTSPWLQPLLVPLAVSAMFVRRDDAVRRRTVFGIAIGIAFVLVVWWTCTHRIDRFLVPIIPFASILAAVGAVTICVNRAVRTMFAVLFGVSLIYGFIVGASPAPGKNATLLAPLESQRSSPLMTTPWASWFRSQRFNAHAPHGAVLLVGEAKAFFYDSPVLYSSCFSETPLRAILESDDPLRAFKDRSIEYVLVDWNEIARFRSPGNYGFSDFVTPALFDRLVGDGILVPFAPPDLAERELCRGVQVYTVH